MGQQCFQTIYDWLFHDAVSWLNGGSSLPTMAFLYLLARYIKNYPPLWKWSAKWDVFIYLLLSAVMAFMSAFARYKLNISLHMFLYTSPLVILSSLVFLHFFSQLHIKSKAVNYVAGSVFAVYLFHGNPLIVEEYYNNTILGWFTTNSTILFLIKTIVFLVIVYVVAVLIDQLRIWIWKKIS